MSNDPNYGKTLRTWACVDTNFLNSLSTPQDNVECTMDSNPNCECVLCEQAESQAKEFHTKSHCRGTHSHHGKEPFLNQVHRCERCRCDEDCTYCRYPSNV